MFKPSLLRPYSRVLALLAVVVLAVGCSDDADEPKVRHLTVNTEVPVQSASYDVRRLFVGRVTANQRAALGFEMPGKIAAIPVNVGDQVSVGDVLAQLDQRFVEVELKEQQAQLKEAQAQLALVESSLKREAALKQKGFTAEQRMDELRAERLVLIASIDRLKAGLEAAQLRLEKSALRAPFDGVVSERYRDVGSVTKDGEPVIQLIETGTLEALVGVPARLAASLEIGQNYDLTIAGQPRVGRLIAASSDVSFSTRTVALRFAVSGEDLLDGQLAVLQLAEGHEAAGYWLPAAALTDGLRGLWYVYAAEPAEQGLHRIAAINVRVLHVENEQVYVQGPLTGQEIVSEGLHRVVPGQLVTLAKQVASQ